MALAKHLKRYRSVLAVRNEGSTAGAARVLPLSQSAIARAIRELEAGLGVALFERGARGMLPTAVCDLLAYRARRALDQLARAEAEVQAIAGDEAALPPGRFAGRCAYRHLAVYIAFCETRAEAPAAARLGVSQPAVNQTLRQLEHMVGARLFLRSARGLRLTEAGEMVLLRAKLALSEFRHAEEDLAAFQGRMRGRIVIGSLPLSAGVLVPRAVDRVLARHKDVQVTIVDGTYESLMSQLVHADIDVIVGALRPGPTPPDVVREPLFEDTLSVVVRHGHPLVGAKRGGLGELVDETWIAPLRGTPAREAFERAFLAAGVSPPRVSLEVNSAVVLQALLLDSDRLALLSRRQIIRGISAGLLSVLPVDVQETRREIGLTLRADGDLGASMKSFIEEIHRLADAQD